MNEKSVADRLREARALIEDEANWTQGRYALDQSGNPVETATLDATCFCGEGALYHVHDVMTQVDNDIDIEPSFQQVDGCREALNLYRAAATELARLGTQKSDGLGIAPLPSVGLNDGDIIVPGLTPHQAVLLAYDKAIHKAEELGL